jgi:hypothetical protein
MSNDPATGSYETERKQSICDEARITLRRRYAWEVGAVTQDIMNKVEMGVLNISSISSYLSNLLMSHPRTKVPERSSETLMCSDFREAFPTGEEPRAFTLSYGCLDAWNLTESTPSLRMMAYYAMGADVFESLLKEGFNFNEE